MLSHASRQFKYHEANYPPFLIDMPNALYGMDGLDQYLRSQPFILYMDERPEEDICPFSCSRTPIQFRHPEQNRIWSSAAPPHHVAHQDQRHGPK